MVQCGGGVSFSLEPSQPVFILSEFPAKHFYGNAPTKSWIFGEVYFAHASFADLTDDFVRTYALQE